MTKRSEDTELFQSIFRKNRDENNHFSSELSQKRQRKSSVFSACSDINHSSGDQHRLLEEIYANKISLLRKTSSHFFHNTSLVIKIGIELEFYLLNPDQSQILNEEIVDDFIAELSKKVLPNSLVYKIEKEQGVGQIEIKTTYDSDLIKICQEIEVIKAMAKNLALTKNLVASFASQQFLDDCGSALQFNISLHDLHDANIFNSDPKILNKVVNGLLSSTNSMMIFLAPLSQDYVRFSFDINRNLFKRGKFTAPVNLSFGADNRTCAIRIPTQKNKRLEYRIASSDADPAICFSSILLAILFGIKSEVTSQIKQIHGNAFEDQYEIKNFCQSLEEARRFFFAEENFIREFLFKRV